MASNRMRTITLKEVSEHARPGNAWVAMHGRVYDISAFASEHPGGDVIALAGGTDATILFESYHLLGVSPKLLESLQIGFLPTDVAAASHYTWGDDVTGQDAFYPTLKRRVAARLRKLGRSRRGGVEMFAKTLLILSVLFGTWWLGFVKGGVGTGVGGMGMGTLLLAAAYGVAAAHVGLSIMHDGNHGSYSTFSRVNVIMGMGMDLIGGSKPMWEFQHVIGHHAYTNLETPTKLHLERHRRSLDTPLETTDADRFLSHENDPDVFSSFPLIRMHPQDAHKWFHKYQVFYCIPLFSLLTLSKVFISDASYFMAGQVYHISTEARMSLFSERITFITAKLLTIVLMLVIPVIQYGWTFAIAMTLVAHAVCGLYLSLVFIVSHVSDLAEFHTANVDDSADDRRLKLVDTTTTTTTTTTTGTATTTTKRKSDAPGPLVSPHDWARLQVTGSVNWSSGSWLANTFSGGLNHQIEHHLFPGLAHTNHPYINDVVRETCSEYGVEYNDCGTFASAVAHFLSHLRALGDGSGGGIRTVVRKQQ